MPSGGGDEMERFSTEWGENTEIITVWNCWLSWQHYAACWSYNPKPPVVLSERGNVTAIITDDGLIGEPRHSELNLVDENTLSDFKVFLSSFSNPAER